MRESINSFRSRINNYNLLHHTTVGKATQGGGCDVCGKYEKDHPSSVSYVCSNCVINLLDLSPAEKKSIHEEAISKNFTTRAETLKHFLGLEDKKHEQSNRRIRSRSKRKRPIR